jgi:hypothetical protein
LCGRRVSSFCLWVWALKITHYTGDLGKSSFFGLGCFTLVVCVWEEGLVHTVNVDVMLGCVSVVWGHVGASIPVTCA